MRSQGVIARCSLHCRIARRRKDATFAALCCVVSPIFVDATKADGRSLHGIGGGTRDGALVPLLAQQRRNAFSHRIDAEGNPNLLSPARISFVPAEPEERSANHASPDKKDTHAFHTDPASSVAFVGEVPDRMYGRAPSAFVSRHEQSRTGPVLHRREGDRQNAAAPTSSGKPAEAPSEGEPAFHQKGRESEESTNMLLQGIAPKYIPRPVLLQELSTASSTLRLTARSGSTVVWVVLALAAIAVCGIVGVSFRNIPTARSTDAREARAQERFEASKKTAGNVTASDPEPGLKGNAPSDTASSRPSRTRYKNGCPDISSDDCRNVASHSWLRKLAPGPSTTTQTPVPTATRVQEKSAAYNVSHTPLLKPECVSTQNLDGAELSFTVPVDILANLSDEGSFLVRSTSEPHTIHIHLREAPAGDGSLFLEVRQPKLSETPHLTIGPVSLDEAGLQRLDIRFTDASLYGVLQLEDSGAYSITANGQVQFVIDDSDGGLNLTVATKTGACVATASCIAGPSNEENLEIKVCADANATLVVAAVLAVVLLPQRQ